MKCFKHDQGKVCPDCGLDRREEKYKLIAVIKTLRKPNASIAMPAKWRELVINALEQYDETQSPSSAP